MPKFGIIIIALLLSIGLSPLRATAQQPPQQDKTSPSTSKKPSSSEERAKQEEARRKLAAYKLTRADAQTQERAKALRGRVATLDQELERAASDQAKAACINGVVFMAFSLQEDIKREEKLLALAQERAALHRGRQAHAKTQRLIDALKTLRAQLAKGQAPGAEALERLTVDAEELIRLTHLILTQPSDKPQANKAPSGKD